VAQLAKVLIVLGLALAGVGVLLFLANKLGVGRLPGDFTWRGKNWVVHFPLLSSILISLLLTVLLNLWFGRNR
jgi:ribose/xylose/arabinose/galactoside ABC-type transport system permease subunit